MSSVVKFLTPRIRLRPLARRTMLRSAGACLALPLLESMMRAADPIDDRTNRMVVFMSDLGLLPQNFFPQGIGLDYQDSRYTKILAPFRQRLTILSGCALPYVDGQHDADICYLTGTPRPQSPSFRNGLSLDLYAASQIGKETRYGHIATSNHAGRTMTFNASGAKVPASADPLALYKLLFVDDPNEAERMIAALQQKKSILDNLLEPARSLDRQIAAPDRQKLDQYFTAVREAEKQLERTIAWSKVAKPKPTTTAPRPDEYGNDALLQTSAFQKLIALAIQTDQTRVATLLISGAFGSQFTYDGQTHSSHGLSHHAHDPAKMAILAHYEESLLQSFRSFLESLDAVYENGRSLLDRTIVTFGSCLSDGHSHTQSNLPTLVVGGGFKHRGHLHFEGDGNYPLTNLYLSILQKLGIEADRFSTSTGTLRGLEA